jgi:hypothetical protein
LVTQWEFLFRHFAHIAARATVKVGWHDNFLGAPSGGASTASNVSCLKWFSVGCCSKIDTGNYTCQLLSSAENYSLSSVSYKKKYNMSLNMDSFCQVVRCDAWTHMIMLRRVHVCVGVCWRLLEMSTLTNGNVQHISSGCPIFVTCGVYVYHKKSRSV